MFCVSQAWLGLIFYSFPHLCRIANVASALPDAEGAAPAHPEEVEEEEEDDSSPMSLRVQFVGEGGGTLEEEELDIVAAATGGEGVDRLAGEGEEEEGVLEIDESGQVVMTGLLLEMENEENM